MISQQQISGALVKNGNGSSSLYCCSETISLDGCAKLRKKSCFRLKRRGVRSPLTENAEALGMVNCFEEVFQFFGTYRK